MSFEEYRKAALDGLNFAVAQEKADDGILPLLEKINKTSDYYTTSSCFGRIVVSEATSDNRKKEYRFLGKWHRKVSVDEAREAISRHGNDLLFFRLDPMILHVGCRDMDSADRLLRACQKAGLKRSGIYQIEPRIIVEIMGVDSIAAPIGHDGTVLADDEQIEFLVGLANAKMSDNEEKMRKLSEFFKG